MVVVKIRKQAHACHTRYADAQLRGRAGRAVSEFGTTCSEANEWVVLFFSLVCFFFFFLLFFRSGHEMVQS